MPPDLEILVSLRHAPKQSKEIAAYLAWVRGERVGDLTYPPVMAAPVRRCETCGSRACWTWIEPRPGAGEWVSACVPVDPA